MNEMELRIVRYVIAVIWLVTAAVSMGLFPVEQSLEMVAPLGLPRSMALVVVYGAAVLDLVMAILTLRFPRPLVWLAQIALILLYTVLATVLVPDQWLHPFAPLLKNLAVLALLWLLYRHSTHKELRQ